MTALLDKLEAAGIRLRWLRDGENRCACPKCDKAPNDDALALRIVADRAVWVCHRCGWTGATSTSNDPRSTQPARQPRIPQPSDQPERYELARRIWVEAQPLAGTLGAEYLTRRACVSPPDDGDVRFHPRLFCAAVGRQLPALVCRVSTVRGNRGMGVHRIFLDPLGSDKAIAKLRLGSADEPVCIRLYPDEEVTFGLGIAEGVETALAAARLHSPMWATIDAGQMTVFPVLGGIEMLTIYADHDRAGIDAATACAERWRRAGKGVVALAPARRGTDVNDLVREAANA